MYPRPSTIVAIPLTPQNKDILLLRPSYITTLPTSTERHVRTAHTMIANIPTKIRDPFALANAMMLHPDSSTILPTPNKEIKEIYQKMQNIPPTEDVSPSILPKLDTRPCPFMTRGDRARRVILVTVLAYISKEEYLGGL